MGIDLKLLSLMDCLFTSQMDLLYLLHKNLTLIVSVIAYYDYFPVFIAYTTTATEGQYGEIVSEVT
jgi:hypothetical protein